MKQNKFIKAGIVALFTLLFAMTTSIWGNTLSDIPDTWTEMFPDPGFTYQELTPSCAACPGCDPKFSFFVKGGSTNNLVIYFMGGGACWHINNCLYYPTYYQEVPNLDEFTDTRGLGIFDTEILLNPFRRWNFVFIPYCTGDTHWGANDKEYTDDETSWTVRHRGFVNFQAVLHWTKKHFRCPRKIFVTGSSAGAYGATLAFPHIKEAYPRSKVFLLGDAGNGVTGGTFPDEGISNWNVQLPTWIPGLDVYYPEMTIDLIYKNIARYYRWSKIAQFTTGWDWNQTFYYNLMQNIEYLDPGAWQTGWQDPEVRCDWNNQMLGFVYSAAAEPNYRYYIAGGDYHTILMSPEFYLERSAGIPFFMWVKAMIRNPFGLWGGPLEGLWKNLECEECEAPVECVP